MYVNGTKLGGYGTPAPTDPVHSKLYTTHDVADLLIEGDNCITADAHYLGSDCQNSVNGRPGFRLELHWQDTDGKTSKLLLDTSWQVRQVRTGQLMLHPLRMGVTRLVWAC